MSDAADRFALPSEWLGILRPPPELGIVEWCERHRVLQEKHAAQPGRFSLAPTPYLREIYEAFTDPDVGTLIVIKSSRCGGTEFLNNLLAWSADCRPMPTIFVLPRDVDVREEFQGRIKGIFEASPKLAGHIPGGTWATDEGIYLDRMTVMGAAATAASNFIRRTSGVNLFDEVDNCQKHADPKLGDIWALLEERITTFGHRGKQVGVTTPTTADAAGWRAYLRSDRRRYLCPCPACGLYQELVFERLKWPGDVADPDAIEAERLARYQCESDACGHLVADEDKAWLVDRGLWVPHRQKVAQRLDVASPELVARAAAVGKDRWRPRLDGAAKATRNRGYWIHGSTLSPWRSFSQIAAKFLRVKDNPHEFKVFVNSWKGEAWQEAVKTTEADDLLKLSELGLPADVVPDRAVLLLAGADVQGDRIYYVVQAYGPGGESWMIRWGIVETFPDLHGVTLGARYKRPDGTDLPVSFVAVDSGHRTSEVYGFAREHPGEVFAVKGRDVLDEKWRPAQVEYTPKGDRRPSSVRLYHVNTSFFKERIHAQARRQPGAVGEWHLHRDVSQAFLEQATAEHQVYERPTKKRARGRWAWKPKSEGRPNHALDTLVYVSFLADLKNVRNLRPRPVVEAAESMPAPRPAGGGGVRTADGRPFLVTQRR